MKDSTNPSQDESATPAERPAWRFSGRRGTPVHLRDQAPQTLPPEIRTAITQLARERTGESAPAPDARPVRAAAATSSLQLNRDVKSAPPVAAAPMPVERRARRDSAEPEVATSPIPAAEAPLAPIELPPVDASHEPTPDLALDAAPAIEATPEPDAESTLVAESAPAAAADAAVAEAPKPAQPKLTPAERKKRAKARAKARARSQRPGKKGFGETTADGGRRLFARGRELDAGKAAAIEPAAAAVGVDAPTPTASADAPTVTPDADAPTPEAVVDIVAASADTHEPATTPDMPAPILATENGAQAAWELGRLPILLNAPTPTPEPEPEPEPTIDIPSAPSWETVTAADMDALVLPTRSRDREVAPRSMHPIDWRAIGGDPAPAPIEPADLPRRATPDAIARLDAPLEVQENVFTHGRASARDDGAPATSRASDARRRIARRRAELNDVVHMLAGLGSGRRDS